MHNGYFMMIMPFLLIQFFKQLNNSNHKLIKGILLLTSMILLFAVILLIQERSCILISALVFMLYLWRSYKAGSKAKKLQFVLVSFVAICLLLYLVLPSFLEYISESRFSTSDGGVRKLLLRGCIEFIPSNLLLGGWQSFIAKYDFPPHNLFLNACVEAGLFGFVIASVLYIKQIRIALTIPHNNNNCSICLAFLAYTLNSQLHNDSILTGDAIVWLLWGMVLSIYKEYEYQCAR